MKKVVIGIIVVIVIVAIGIGTYLMLNSEQKENKENANQNIVESQNEKNVTKDEDVTNNQKVSSEENLSNGGKTIVVYFSAQNHTKAVAEKIADKLNADIFEIIPEDKYTSEDLDWTDNNSRVSKEHEDDALRNVKLEKDKVDNWDEYDTVLIGYPIWWGVASWTVDTFVKANDFDGKRVIPFCTSTSSGLGQSGKLLEREANGGNWEDGHRFKSNPTDNDINDWVDSIK